MTNDIIKYESELASLVYLNMPKQNIEEAFHKLVALRKEKRSNAKCFCEALKFLINHNHADLVLNVLKDENDRLELLTPAQNETTKKFFMFTVNSAEYFKSVTLDLFNYALSKEKFDLAFILLQFIFAQFKDVELEEINFTQMLEQNNTRALIQLVLNHRPKSLDNTPFILTNDDVYQIMKDNKVSMTIDKLGYKTPDDLETKILNENPQLVDALISDVNKLNKHLTSLIEQNKYKTIAYLSKIIPELHSHVSTIIISNPCILKSEELFNLLKQQNYLFTMAFVRQYLSQIISKVNPGYLATSSLASIEKSTNHLKKNAVIFERCLEQFEPDKLNNILAFDKVENTAICTLIIMSIRYDLPILRHRLVDTMLIQNLHDEMYYFIFENCIQANDTETLSLFLPLISKKSRALKKIIETCSHGIMSETILNIVFTSLKNEMMQNAKIKKIIANTHSPWFTKLLIETDGKFAEIFLKSKFNELYQIALHTENIACVNFFKKYIDKEPSVEIDHLSVGEPKSSEDNFSEMPHIYGEGLSQSAYRVYQRYMSAIVCQALVDHTFSFDLTDHNDYQKVNPYFLGLLRHDIAMRMTTCEFRNFGKVRTPDRFHKMITPISGRYQYYLGQLLSEHVGNIYKDRASDDESNEFNITYFKFENGEVCFCAEIQSALSGNTLLLTEYSTNEEYLSWEHTGPEKIDVIFEHVTILVNTITAEGLDLSYGASQKEFLEKLAEIHWWLTQATPYERGSAAIIEAIVKGICMFHGYDIHWCHENIINFMPDCVALTSINPKQYSTKYVEFSQLIPLPCTQIYTAETQEVSFRM